MNARIAQLESLLTRVQQRAAAPRPVAAAPLQEATAEDLELDEPTLDAAPAPASAEVLELDEPELEAAPHSAAPVSELEVDEIDELELDEHQPESGPVASVGMDAAIDAAASQPPLTPPPESGEGLASPQIPAQEGPTMEQLGETISLEEGKSADFELDEPELDEPDADVPASKLEIDIPASTPPSAEPLAVPEGTREALDRHRLGDSTPVEARISTRPVLSTNVVDLVNASKSFEPKSFLELLDSSLSLK